MAKLAWRNLFHDKVRLAVTLTGIIFAVVLITARETTVITVADTRVLRMQVGQALGRNVRTYEPTERVDKKILETLIELDGGSVLPVGLRVDAFILTGEVVSGLVR